MSGTLPDKSEGKDSHVSSEQASLPTVPEPEKIAEKEAEKDSSVSPQKASLPLHTR